MTERLWNGRPFKNYWNDLSVEKRTEFILKADLKDQVRNYLEWSDLETHHQALLRQVLRSEMD